MDYPELIETSSRGSRLQGRHLLTSSGTRDNPGDVSRCTTHYRDVASPTLTRPLSRRRYDIFVRHNEAAVDPQEGRGGREWWPGNRSTFPMASVSKLVSPRKPFGLRNQFPRQANADAQEPVQIYQIGGTGLHRTRTPLRRNATWIDQWKVFIGGSARRTGHDKDVYPTVSSASRSSASQERVCTETYLVAGRSDTESRGEECSVLPAHATCLASSFSLRKPTQHVYAQGLRVRSQPRMDQALDGRGPLQEVRPHRGRDRVHREDDPPDGPR